MSSRLVALKVEDLTEKDDEALDFKNSTGTLRTEDVRFLSDVVRNAALPVLPKLEVAGYKLNLFLHATKSGQLLSAGVASGASVQELEKSLREKAGALLRER